jgi:hypothetical protein
MAQFIPHIAQFIPHMAQFIPHMDQFNSLQKLQVRNKIQQAITDMASSLGSMSHETPRSGFSSNHNDIPPQDIC